MANNSYAQTNIDSLETILPKLEDSSKVKILNDLSFKYWNISPIKGLDYANLALSLSKELNYLSGEKIALRNIGTNYWATSNFEKALEYYLKSLKISEDINDREGVSIILNNVGMIYNELKNYVKALEYFSESLKIKKELNDRKRMANTINNIGLIYTEQKNYDKALEYYNQSLLIANEFDDKRAVAEILKNIGSLHISLEDYDKALEFVLNSLSISELINDKKGIAESSFNLGSIYTKQNNLSLAKKFISESMKISIEINDKSVLYKDYKYFSDIYIKENNHEKSLHYFKLYSSLKDSVFSEENRTISAEMNSNIEFVKKESEIKLLQKDNDIQNLTIERQNDLRNFLFAGIGLVLILASVIYNRYRLKNKAHNELQEHLLHIKKLEGLLPICCNCKKIRHGKVEDKDNWVPIEKYISDRTDADFSHGICNDCAEELYPNLFDGKNKKQ